MDIPSGYWLERRDRHTYQPRRLDVNGEGEVVVGMWKTLDRTIAHFLSGRESGTGRGYD